METNNEAEWLSLYWHVPGKENQHRKDNSDWGFKERNRGIIKSKIIYEHIQHISEETKDSYI